MGKPQKSPPWDDIFDMPLEELKKRTQTAEELLQQIVDLFPGLITLTDDERRHSSGRIRRGEGAMFLVLLSVMEAFPQFFEGLADLDEGVDPNQVETELMRDRVQRAEVLAPLLEQMGKLDGIADSVLHLRAKVREPLSQAYGIAKVMAKTHPALRSMLAPVLDFYASMAKAAAASRKANAENKGQAKG